VKIRDLIEASSLGTPEARAVREEGSRLARGGTTPPDDALDQIAGDLTSGYIDETEAIARCEDAGCTPHGAMGHVSRWTA
jgi:hypothetical protein